MFIGDHTRLRLGKALCLVVSLHLALILAIWILSPDSALAASANLPTQPQAEVLPLPWFDNGENGPGAWTADPPWALVAHSDSDPAYSGSYAWSDSPGGNYDNNVNNSLYTPLLDVSNLGGMVAILSYQIWSDLDCGRFQDCSDYFAVEYAIDGGAWQQRYISGEADEGRYYRHVALPLLIPSGANQLQIRFRLWTNDSHTEDGVHLDDIGVAPSTFTCSGVSEIPQSECQTLLALYVGTNGVQWNNSSGWLETITPCSWHGVSCENGSINALDLSNNELSGTIPPELSNLTNLQTLGLHTNALFGAIPDQLGNLANLQTLSIGGNQLSGPIPGQLGNLANLQNLDLRGNRWLTGTIPSELGNLAHLQMLSIGGNQLSGPIPAQLGNLANLQTLSIGSNQLSGPIPAQLGNLANLHTLYLYSNELSGTIPSELGNLINLQILSIGSNSLSGSIPVELGRLANLQTLSLDNNQLSGAIPGELDNLVNLQTLNLYNNQLSGAIPAQLANLANLQELSLNGNQFSGTVPSELGNLANLQILDLSSNELSGAIPAELGNLATLQILDLSFNQLSGAIPLSFPSLLKLEEFYFSETNLCQLAVPFFQSWLEGLSWGGPEDICITPIYLLYLPISSRSESSASTE